MKEKQEFCNYVHFQWTPLNPPPHVNWLNVLGFFSLCSLLLDKKFKSELVRMSAEAAAKLGTRPNRYETLLKQRHVQVQFLLAEQYTQL